MYKYKNVKINWISKYLFICMGDIKIFLKVLSIWFFGYNEVNVIFCINISIMIKFNIFVFVFCLVFNLFFFW